MTTEGVGGAPAPNVRMATAADAAAAASLHAEQIAQGFLSFLGPRFLAHLYRRIALAPDSFLLVADDADQVVGFIAGSTEVGALYRSFLWHDGARASTAAAGRLLVGWRRVLETLRHGSGGAVGTGRGAELLAVAVDPGRQGRGVGGELVAGFLSEVERRGGRAAYVVVASDNSGAIGLYRRAGFAGGQEFELHAGATSLLMQWDRKPLDAGREEST